MPHTEPLRIGPDPSLIDPGLCESMGLAQELGDTEELVKNGGLIGYMGQKWISFQDFGDKQLRPAVRRSMSLLGGNGPPILLLHRYPQTHIEWRKIAPDLSKNYTLVMPDLRGYGGSGKPPVGDNHINYSKRAWHRTSSK